MISLTLILYNYLHNLNNIILKHFTKLNLGVTSMISTSIIFLSP
jgi:hypothetical protein